MHPPFWLKLLPAPLRHRLEHHPDAMRIAGNIAWLLGDRVLRLGLGLAVGIWLARYLGPEQFGQLNFALAFIAIAAVLGGLGLNSIVVRDLVHDPDSADTTLGSAFLLLLGGGLLALLLVVLGVAMLRPGDSSLLLMVAVLGSGLLFRASDVLRFWFDYRVAAKYAVWVDNAVFLLGTVLRIGLIVSAAPLMAFVWLSSAEAALVAGGLFAAYARQGGRPGRWQWRKARGLALLASSWPLILSGLAVIVYMRIDQLMLGQMLGEAAVGHYSAAIRISEVWYFLPMAIVSSVTPLLLAARKEDPALYYRRLQRLFNLLTLISLAVAIAMSFLSGWLVTRLYGASYASAGPVLAVHIWTGVFVFLGTASGPWLIAEGLERIAFYRTLAGALINIALNLVLIPAFGGLGAALATVAAQMTAAWLFDFFHPRTRILFSMKTKSLMGHFLSSPFRKP